MAKILVVDDDPAIRDLLAMMLPAGGHAVDTASSAVAAFTMLDKTNYDVLILDHNMPGMTGIEAAARLRTNPAHARMKIIILSADSREEHSDESMVAGADGYIGKPITQDELLNTIKAVLNRE